MGGIDHPRYWFGAWVLWWRLYECPVSELNKISAKGRNGGKKKSGEDKHTRRQVRKNTTRVIRIHSARGQSHSQGRILPTSRLAGLRGSGAYQASASRATDCDDGCGRRSAEEGSGGGTEHDGCGRERDGRRWERGSRGEENKRRSARRRPAGSGIGGEKANWSGSSQKRELGICGLRLQVA